MKKPIGGRVSSYVDYRGESEESKMAFSIDLNEKEVLEEACRRSDLRGGC